MTELIAGVRIYDILILLLIFALPAVIRTAVEAFRRKNTKRPFIMPRPLCRIELLYAIRAGSASTTLLCICAISADIKIPVQLLCSEIRRKDDRNRCYYAA